MKTIELKISLFFLFFLMKAGGVFAQIDVFEDEIENRNGIIYYQNELLTGTVYSNDEEAIPNACQCTLKAYFTDGKLNGEKLEFYQTGKLKSKGSYKNGKPVGEHLKYNQEGQVLQKKTYREGEPIETVYFKDNVILKKEIYHNGQLQVTQEFDDNKLKKQTNYYPDKTEVIEYFQNGKTKVKGYYKDHLKTGTWTFFDESGQKNLEKIYYKNELLGEGKYTNGQKEGVWYQYSPDKKIKTIKIYQTGKLIKTKTENSAYAIKNYNFKPNEIVLTEQNKITGDTLYYAWNPKINPADHPDLKQVKKTITYWVTRHADSAPSDLSFIGKKTLTHRFEIRDVIIQYKTLKHPRTRTVNGREEKYNDIEYLATLEYKIYVYPVGSSDIAEILNFRNDSKGSFGRGLLTAALGAYPKNREEAFNRMLKNINIYKLAVKYFPAYTQIADIKSQNSKKIKSVKTADGMFNKIYKGAYFKVYDKQSGTFKALIRIYKAESNYAFGKVVKDGAWLKNYINEYPHPWIKEFYPKK